MDQHKKKMIAPVFITVLFLVYLAIYGFLMVKAASQAGVVLLLLGIPLVVLGGGMVYVLIARIREIRSGEEDDLGNY